MVLWAIGHLSSEEMLGITETPLPDMSGIPPWMVRLLEYPYLSGAAFVGQLYATGGWDAVDAAYDDLPVSSEQVLHPAKYLAAEAPIEVEPLDLWSVVGSDWTHGSETTMGEAWIATWLEGIGVDRRCGLDRRFGLGRRLADGGDGAGRRMGARLADRVGRPGRIDPVRGRLRRAAAEPPVLDPGHSRLGPRDGGLPGLVGRPAHHDLRRSSRASPTSTPGRRCRAGRARWRAPGGWHRSGPGAPGRAAPSTSSSGRTRQSR